MTGELAPPHHAEDRCARCSAVFADHFAGGQGPWHHFTPVPRGLVREFVLTDQAARYLAFEALYWSR